MLPYPEIDPVAIALGPVKVHWYGLTYLAALGFAWWLAARRSQRPGAALQREQVDDLIFFGALGVVLGGRIGYALFYGADKLAQDPAWLLRVWQGGMSFHGGMLGVMLAMYLFARRRRIGLGPPMCRGRWYFRRIPCSWPDTPRSFTSSPWRASCSALS